MPVTLNATYTGAVITASQYRHIAALIKTVADTEIAPRFNALSDGDIDRKAGGDLVTTADREAERVLRRELEPLVDGSVTVGEESVADNPQLLDHLSTDTPAWVIDPVDGTANFVAGDLDYCCLVSLSTHDTTHASWLYAPSLGLTAGALTGHGAWINDEPAEWKHRDTTGGLDVVTTHPNYTDGYQALAAKLDGTGITTTPCRTAGLSYVDIVQGRHDAVVYTWEHPWDHAAGLHLLHTLGGTSATADGTPFALSGGNRLPFVAGDPRAVAALRTVLAD